MFTKNKVHYTYIFVTTFLSQKPTRLSQKASRRELDSCTIVEIKETNYPDNGNFFIRHNDIPQFSQIVLVHIRCVFNLVYISYDFTKKHTTEIGHKSPTEAQHNKPCTSSTRILFQKSVRHRFYLFVEYPQSYSIYTHTDRRIVYLLHSFNNAVLHI